MEEQIAQLQTCMYQYSRAIYRSIKDSDRAVRRRGSQIEARRDVLEQCEGRWSAWPRIRSTSPGRTARSSRTSAATSRSPAQAQVAWAVREGVGAPSASSRRRSRPARSTAGSPRCKATTRKGKACQRTPLPERDYCPSHQHLDRATIAA